MYRPNFGQRKCVINGPKEVEGTGEAHTSRPKSLRFHENRSTGDRRRGPCSICWHPASATKYTASECVPVHPARIKTLTWVQHYLLILRRPRVSDAFKQQLEDTEITSPHESIIRPIKAALHFENVEGFGEWRILLSTKAQKYLREVRRGNGTTFEVVVKKIK